MKKLSLYIMLAFAGLFMIACGPEENEFVGLKVAEAESPVIIPGISAGQVGIIDLNKVVISDKMDIEAFTVSGTTLPDGVELTKAEIEFEDGTILPATTDGRVSGLALSAYITSIFGQLPEVRSVDGTVYLYATQNGAAVKIDTGEINFQVVPKAYNDYIWQAGNSNGWGTPAAPLFGADNDGKYVGFMYLDGEFKFRSHEDSWDAPDWGACNTDGSLAEKGDNLSAEAGYYQVNADLAAMTYSLTPITTIGIVGPAQDGGWDADTDMTYNKETGAWEATIDLKADEMKFRANDGWDINWGGTEDALTQDGANIKIAEAGSYFIQLFAYCDGKAYCKITKK